MRIAVWFLAALCIASPGFAQSVIEWSAVRGLTRDDFRGRPPTNASIASMSWLNVEASWECDGSRLVSKVRATFDPSRSWWRPGYSNIWENATERTSVTRTQEEARRNLAQRDIQLLDHEQLHFDITELAARKVRQKFEEMKTACSEAGDTESLHQVVVDTDRALQEEQRKYDAETANGTNEAAQDRWRSRIRQQLGLPGH